jgi:nicotinamidase-related amidase
VTVLASEPYPWPWDGRLDAGRLALVVAGVQRWAVPLAGSAALCAALEQALQQARTLGALVVWTRHSAPRRPGRAPSVLPQVGETAWDLAITPRPGDVVIDAGGLDGFFGGSLDTRLRAEGRDLLAMAGAPLETVVHSTLRSANDRGYECVTLTDLCGAGQPELRPAAISTICMSGGIFGAVADSPALWAALAAAPPALADPILPPAPERNPDARTGASR